MFVNKEEVQSLGYDIFKQIQNDGYSNILEKILVTNTLLTSYDCLQLRFDSNNINYDFSCLEDLKKIFGFNIKNVKGYNKLDDYHREIFDKHFLSYINSSGLEYKIYKLPRKIILEAEKKRFKVYTLEIDKFSYLDFNGTWY